MAKQTSNETPSLAVRKITIQGEMLSVQDKYAEGDTINALEAAALNQTRAENMRNNQASNIKKIQVAHKEAGEPETLTADELAQVQSDLDDYAATYVFSAGGGRTTDPIDKEAKLIAGTMLDGLLAKAGVTKKAYGEDKYAAKITEIMGMPAVRADAEKRVGERNALANSIDLS